MYEEQKIKLKSLLCSAITDLDSLSFTADGWKSRSGDAYLDLTCHYVDKEFNCKSFNLSNNVFGNRQTGENIANF